jgi:hypothetical protein
VNESKTENGAKCQNRSPALNFFYVSSKRQFSLHGRYEENLFKKKNRLNRIENEFDTRNSFR